MDQHAYLGDPQREREIRHLLDQIQVPDESLSDVSSDNIGRSTFEPESHIFARGLNSPGRHHEDFFENSINSTIAHTSPLSNLHLNEDSKIDSSMSQSFTPHQVSRMMDWSKNHITQAEGIFPQVSAPSMSIEGDIWDSPQDTPQPTLILRSYSSADRTNNQSKKSISNLPILDLPTHEEKPSREVITFSPNNAEANWYFHPMQNSKRSSTNQSLKFPKNSFSTELMQGSALLAHAANHHFPSEISLSHVRDNAPMFDEIHRLKTELANIKVAFRSEQTMHEETKKELYACSNALQELENYKLELEDKNAELDERVKLMQMKQKNPESLEQLRGKSLEYARMQIKELKGYLSEKDKKIEDYKHVLIQRNNLENNSAREKEIEELTYEITKLKILNGSQSKQIKELNERLDKEGKAKEHVNGDLRNVVGEQENRLKKTQDELQEVKKELNEKNKELEKLQKMLKDLKQSKDNETEAKRILEDELEQAKNSLEILQKQVAGSQFERTSAGDYEFQLSKVRGLYEKKLEECKEELNQAKAGNIRFEGKIKDLEAQVSRLMAASENTFDDEAKETIEMMHEELNRLSSEAQDANLKLLESKNTERKLTEQLSKISSDKKEAESRFSSKETEHIEHIRMLENLNNEYTRNLEILKNEGKNYKDLLSQYEEELEKNRFAFTQHQQLTDKLKKQIEELRSNEVNYKQKIREDLEQDIMKMKNSIQSLTAKSQFEKDELYQKLRERDQEIFELKQELEESFRNNEDKLRMDLEFYKQKLDKEKEVEITKIKKIYGSQMETQTSFDYSNLREEVRAQVEAEWIIKGKMNSLNEENLRKQAVLEAREKLEHEFGLKMKELARTEKEVYERKVEEMKSDYNKKIENLKSEYNKNTAKIEQEFLNKVKSIESEYGTQTNKSVELDKKGQEIFELQRNLKSKEDELVFTQKHLKELEQVLAETQRNLLLKQTSIINSQEDLENIIKKVKTDTKQNLEHEKSELIQKSEQQKQDLVQQYEKSLTDHKKSISDLKSKLQEAEDLNKSLVQDLQDHKSAYEKDIRDSERAWHLKEKKLERELTEKNSELRQEFEEKLLREQEKYAEMMSKKDILSKADNQRVKDEVASLISEKEKELQDLYLKKQKALKAQFDKELRDKENELDSVKETFEGEKRKLKEELNEKINGLRQESQKNKREYERELKKMTQQVENALETAKKDLEIQHLDSINKEKADWDRKEKVRVKLMQTKAQKDLQDREKVLKLEFDSEKTAALEEQSELFQKKLKQVQEDTKKYYEDLKTTTIKEKLHEIELKVRKELQDNYLKTISQLDSQHFQEKEMMREEFRAEMSKRVEEVRLSTLNDQDGSYFDMPMSGKKVRQSMEDSFVEMKQQIQVYKNRIEQLESGKGDSGTEGEMGRMIEAVRRYEEELKNLSGEYKAYVLKSKEWLEASNRRKEEWTAEKERLEDRLRDLTERLSESSNISPEMLSPEETSSLILGIFKRSNQNSLIIQLLKENSEFVSILTNLIEDSSPRSQKSIIFHGQRFETEPVIASSRSFKRPKSVDGESQAPFSRPPRSQKFASPISISQNYPTEHFMFPYANY